MDESRSGFRLFRTILATFPSAGEVARSGTTPVLPADRAVVRRMRRVSSFRLFHLFHLIASDVVRPRAPPDETRRVTKRPAKPDQVASSRSSANSQARA